MNKDLQLLIALAREKEPEYKEKLKEIKITWIPVPDSCDGYDILPEITITFK